MNYITFCSSVVCMLWSFFVQAQADTTYYFTKGGTYSLPADAVTYKRVQLLDSVQPLYSCEEFSIDGTLKSKGFILQNNFSLYTGLYTRYYKNGKKSEEGNYLTDLSRNMRAVKEGLWTFWYENGIKEEEQEFILYEKDKISKADIINHWDSTGKQTLLNGNGDYTFTSQNPVAKDSMQDIVFTGKVKDKKMDGLWKGFYADGSLYCEETYGTEGLIKGESRDLYGKKYSYEKTETWPEFPGGERELMNFIAKNTQYPQLERDNDIQGKVLVGFYVNADGKVGDIQIRRSVSPGLDREALRVTKLIQDFHPGTKRGQPMKVYYALPFVFRLQ